MGWYRGENRDKERDLGHTETPMKKNISWTFPENREPCVGDNVGCTMMWWLVTMEMMPWGVMVAMTPATRRGRKGGASDLAAYCWPGCMTADGPMLLSVCECVCADGHVLNLSFSKWWMKTKTWLCTSCVSVAMVTLSLKSLYISPRNHIAEVWPISEKLENTHTPTAGTPTVADES